MTERILHVAMPGSSDQDAALTRGLQTLGEVRRIDWPAFRHADLQAQICAMAAGWATLVFAHLTRGGTGVDAAVVADLRRLAPGVVVVQYETDVYDEPDSEWRQWWVEFGRACDASLIVTSSWLAWAEAQGVVRPGWLGFGVDCEVFRPLTLAAAGAKVDGGVFCKSIVALANDHGPHYPRYAHRNDLFRRVHEAFPNAFALHGHGWEGSGLPYQRPLEPTAEAVVYTTALAALIISYRNDLSRYASDRLVRCLACGGVPVVEAFPDMRALGLENGVNCLTFHDWPGLCATLECILHGYVDIAAIRRGARALGLRHSWAAKAQEIAALVAQVRAERA